MRCIHNKLTRNLIALGAALTLNSAALTAETQLNVLATVGMISDVAQVVGGDCVQVDTLMGPGVDPHAYSATPADLRKLAAAELILYVDRALEERLADVLGGLRGRVTTLGLVAATFSQDDLLMDPDGGGAFDPHLWMDVSRWARIAPVIADAIAAQRPDCAPELAANAARLGTTLAALHDWVGASIASIPEGNRILVTAHDAFYYFADAYGLEASEGIEGISTASEASIGDIRAVAAFVIENNVPAVFVETTINPRTIEALVAEVRAQGHEVVIGGALFSDAMGDAGTAESTYIGMIRANTITITRALGGQIPVWPEALQDWAGVWNVTP